MTAATVRKSARKFAAWAKQNPYKGGSLIAWRDAGIKEVVGAPPPSRLGVSWDVFRGVEDALPPSWTPEGAAYRLADAVEHSPALKAARAIAAAALAAKKTAFFAAMAPEDAQILGAYMGAPIDAIEGRNVNTAPIKAAKAAVVGATTAVTRARAL